MTLEIVSDVHKFILPVFYHPPTPDHDLNNIFVEDCCNVIGQMLETGLPVVVCGDFNLNILNPLRLTYINRFIDKMTEIGLYPAIRIPTKYNENNQLTRFSILDHIWVSGLNIAKDVYVVPIDLTDHFPVIANFSFEMNNRGE